MYNGFADRSAVSVDTWWNFTAPAIVSN